MFAVIFALFLHWIMFCLTLSANVLETWSCPVCHYVRPLTGVAGSRRPFLSVLRSSLADRSLAAPTGLRHQ